MMARCALHARLHAGFWISAVCAAACTTQPSDAATGGSGAGGALAESGRGASVASAGMDGASGSRSMAGSAASGMDASVAPGDGATAIPARDDAGMAPADGGASDGSRPAAIDPPLPVGCVTDVTPGVHDFACDDTVHSVSIPAQCIGAACGVIVDVHGGMMSSQMEDKNTQLRALGERHGYIVIQPNAQQNPVLLDQRLFVADAPGQPADDTRVMNILHAGDRGVSRGRKADPHDRLLGGRVHELALVLPALRSTGSVAPGAAAWGCGNLANLGLTGPEIGCELSGSDKPAHNIPVLYMQGLRDGLVDPMCADGWIRSHALSALEVGDGTVVAGDPAFAQAKFVRTRYVDPDGVRSNTSSTSTRATPSSWACRSSVTAIREAAT